MDKDDDFDGILIKPDGTAWMLNKKLHLIAIESPYFSTGSGRDFALLAMRMGKTSREAVEIAAELDIWTGMGVTELSLADSSIRRLDRFTPQRISENAIR